MKWILTALTYYLLAEASFLTGIPEFGRGVAMVWLPTGFAVMAIFVFGYRIWPGIALGSLLNAHSTSPVVIAGFVLANTLDPLIATWLPRRILQKEIDFKRHRDVLVFVVTAIMVSSPLSASLGVAALSLDGTLNWQAVEANWAVWWISDVLSVLIITPLFCAWKSWPQLGWSHWDILENIAVWALGAAVLYFIFFMPEARDTIHYVYWIFPFVIWNSFRNGQHVTTAGIFVLSLTTIAATAQGLGPFVGTTPLESYFYAQSFLTVASLTGLLVSATVCERDMAVHNRDEFIMIASHELYTPLTVLSMLSKFLNRLIEKDDLEAMTKAQRLDLVQMNSKETRRLARLVEELLEGSKISAGKLQIDRAELDLAELTREIAAEFSDNAEAPLYLNSQNPVRGVWDPVRMSFVLRTLIGNALKFGNGGAVTVTTEVNGGQAKLTVEDRGIGIAPKNHSRIFERFGRVASPTSYGGLGQGLFISQAIVAAHGGSIHVQSDEGRGAVFTVEIPGAKA